MSHASQNTPATCTTCGLQLVAGAPEDGCMRCMLHFAFALEEGEPPTPRFPSPMPAETLHIRRYGHFLIDVQADGEPVELGHGAMGVTYRGLDTTLETPVALKVIGARVAEHPAARTRFLREARSAALLRHPNVASVFHYGEQEGECFYAMELVEGETLEERVRRAGPLPAALALNIAIQVASALAAAEARGIVHRDLKPANLMLVNPKSDVDVPVVKVIDFGLAKVVTALHAVDRSAGETRGGFVGTPAFASPEQHCSQEDERIDTRSDIYSLGVTLWYLLSGKLPFVGKTLMEFHAQQLRPTLPLAQLKAAAVPAPVATLLRVMLAVAPAERPQSARELLKLLHRCQTALRRRVALRWLGGAGALALLLLSVFLVTRHGQSSIQEERSIAVLPFENRSAAPEDNLFAAGMDSGISDELSKLSELKTITSKVSRDHLPGERDPAKIARRLGVNLLLAGSVQRTGLQLRATVRLLDPTRKDPLWSRQYQREVKEAFSIQQDIARDLVDELHLKLTPEESAAIRQPMTTDPVAYELYARTKTVPSYFNDLAELRRVNRDQIALLEQAVKHDPKFLKAYCQLALLYDKLYVYRRAATAQEQETDYRALAEMALQQARYVNPNSGEVHLAMAQHLFSVVKDDEQARIEIELARRTMPNRAELENIAARIAARQRRYDDAARDLQKACRLDPLEPEYPSRLAAVYRGLRQYAAADEMSERTITLRSAADGFTGRLYRAAGALEARADLTPLRAMLAEPPPAGESAASVADRHFGELILHYYERNPVAMSNVLAGAVETQYDQGINLYFPKSWFEGLAARLSGDTAGAKTAFQAARDYMARAINKDPANAHSLSQLAMIDAALGNKAEAIREGRHACEMLPPSKLAATTPEVACNLAVVYAWTGEPDLALGLLEEWAGRIAGFGYPGQVTYGDLCLNPAWDTLRQNPRFDRLIQRLAPDASRESDDHRAR